MSTKNNWLERIATVKATGRIPIIAEIKSSSPSAGELLGKRNIADVVAAYETGGAACISVVTGRWFGGTLEMLSQAAQATSLPLLRKDLIVNKDQIRQSKDCGASAVLLTKNILRTSHLLKMIDFCHSLDITPFVEVSSIEEINEFSPDSRTILGITNRDITRKEMDTDSGLNSLNLIATVTQQAGAVISASGINNSKDAQRLFQSGFDGLLVGTAFLKTEHPGETLKSFTEQNELITHVAGY